MYYLYTSLLVFHILSAIFGVGPVFLFNMILKRAKSAEQLKYAHHIVEKLNRNANVSFGVILISGLLMGWINPYLFQTEWYIASLVLFFISGMYAIFAVEPILKQMQGIASNPSGPGEISSEYKTLFQRKQSRDMVANLIAVMIILLMVIKPAF
ncbi:hypothetical protein AK95_09285 [Paenibacillus sp. LC231]|uniref:DUF2269 family protein n=1 Tax=unclassified Paenibacillus TaxID=185978 RepID=UPI0008DCE64C|nr:MULTISPECIES: DUF2269 family protein [unclassified Paenibacillus]MCT1401346.1 DUF2269 domain-containing protein [Paenibacillus sp. p3-SID867]OIB03804.1 hypothetical protein AK95_09285 [Paenibacillus sp. LC231]